MVKISVIVPAYNEEKYIEDTLISIKNNTYKNKEIIIVANGCSDNTVNIAKNYSDKIIEINEKNVSKARNIGAENATGDILIFIDADTVLKKNVLSKIIKSKAQLGTIKVKPDNKKILDNQLLNFRNNINKFGFVTGVLFCNKELFLKSGKFNETTKIREFRQLIKIMKKNAKYELIDAYAFNSMRRFNKEGYFKIIYFWLYWLINKKQKYKNIR